jgi:hypothetical protein
MSKRFYYDEFCEEIFDEEIQTYPSNQSICGILNKQADRIAELEEQLKNAIILPKDLQVGNKIFWANDDGLYCGKIYSITKEENSRGGFNVWFCCVYDNGLTYWHLLKDFNIEVFATKEEAQAKLEELKGEKK